MSDQSKEIRQAFALEPGVEVVTNQAGVPVGLKISEDTSYEEWTVYGQKLGLWARKFRWLVGDWVKFFEPQLGDRAYELAEEMTGYARGTLENAVDLCKVWPWELRDPSTSMVIYEILNRPAKDNLNRPGFDGDSNH